MHKFSSLILLFALLFALVFPFILTLNYFVILAHAPPAIQQAAYSIGKAIQFALPILWVGLVCKERFWLRSINRRGLIEGTLFGIAVFAMMLALYVFWLRVPGGVLAPGSPAFQNILDKIEGLGLGKVSFILLGVFYAVIHSGLERYYWGWFVFHKLSCSATLASLGFTAHHVILLGTFFGYASPYTWLGSLGVFIGGWYWCWLYRRTDSIWGAWIGHGLVDAAIFTIGFLILISVVI
ncbi:MAG: hypothetical protein FWE95_08620 [Planctomycetaceae bacterium]|nr:hypothetical protein [Planctomycetaceae bacterium]